MRRGTAILIIISFALVGLIAYYLYPRMISTKNIVVAYSTILTADKSMKKFIQKHITEFKELEKAGVVYWDPSRETYIWTGKWDPRLEKLRELYKAESYKEFWIFGTVRDVSYWGSGYYEVEVDDGTYRIPLFCKSAHKTGDKILARVMWNGTRLIALETYIWML